ncbi:MAG: DUF1822 family protein [Cyanobacteria bacterium SBC]|nr:DUF1822 family protein [Cyanobacteria bacterium SBC]
MKVAIMTDRLTFTVFLSRDAHDRAARSISNRVSGLRAKQLYCNELARYAVARYLNCMGFQLDEHTGESTDPVWRTFANVADLQVERLGRLECRPVLPDDLVLHVPLEAQHDRAGYLAVQLHASLREATIFGFAKTVREEDIPLDRLDSLEGFLQYATTRQEAIGLRQWFQGIFEAGWESMESLVYSPEIAWRRRGSEPPSSLPSTVERVKHLDLYSHPIALTVRLEPLDRSEAQIAVAVYPTQGQIYLPRDLHLKILDEGGNAVMQTIACSTQSIQLSFSAESGEIFTVVLELNDVCLTETFLV